MFAFARARLQLLARIKSLCADSPTAPPRVNGVACVCVCVCVCVGRLCTNVCEVAGICVCVCVCVCVFLACVSAFVRVCLNKCSEVAGMCVCVCVCVCLRVMYILI